MTKITSIYVLVSLCGLSGVLKGISAIPEKISSTLIRNESYTYYYHGTTNKEMAVAFNIFPLNKYYYALPKGQPSWANLSSNVDPTPDINVIGKNQVRLYFTATEKSTQRAAIGVALASELSDKDFTYHTLDTPLIVSQNGETLSNPSLSIEPNGDLFLYYWNSSYSLFGWGFRVQLSRDGLTVIGQPQGY